MKFGDTSNTPTRLLDLSQFASLDDAISKVQPGDRYVKLASALLPLETGMPMTLPVLFWFSMITRSQGLHESIAREIGQTNPHAVLPLVRAFAEAVILVAYVVDHPKYVRTLIDHPRAVAADGLKRKSIQSLIAYAQKQMPGMKVVYAELSEATHFGSIAMWASVIPEGDKQERRISWASSPQWRSDRDALIACAQTIELADAMVLVMNRFAERHVFPLIGREA